MIPSGNIYFCSHHRKVREGFYSIFKKSKLHLEKAQNFFTIITVKGNFFYFVFF
jgi:hypothetical protein